MYNPVNVAVQSSQFLKQALYGILICTVLVTLYQSSHAPLYSTPVVFLCWFYALRVKHNHWSFLTSRHWRLFNGQFELAIGKKEAEPVDVIVQYVRPSFIILKFNLDGRWQWDILLQQNCEYEGFRQLKAMLKIQQQSLQEK